MLWGMSVEELRAELRSLKGSGRWSRLAAEAGLSYFTIQRIVRFPERRPDEHTVAALTEALRRLQAPEAQEHAA